MKRRLFLSGAGAFVALPYGLPVRAAAPADALDVLIADARAAMGLPHLTRTSHLDRAAMEQTRVLVQAAQDHLTHNGAGGATPPQRAAQAGYTGRVLGELLATGPDRDPAPVLEAWLDVAEARAVVLDPVSRDIGLAQHLGADGWTRWSIVTGAPL